jgi:hypothetical protein
MYRHDYSDKNPSPNSGSSRLYDSNYYVMNSDYRVYICLYNGSSGSEPLGKTSKDEPTFTDLEPSTAGIVVMVIYGNIFLQFLQVIL